MITENSNSNTHTHIPPGYYSAWANIQLSKPLLPRRFCLDVTYTMHMCLVAVRDSLDSCLYSLTITARDTGRRRWETPTPGASALTPFPLPTFTHSLVPTSTQFWSKETRRQPRQRPPRAPDRRHNCTNANANNSGSSSTIHPPVINIGSLEDSFRAVDLSASPSTASPTPVSTMSQRPTRAAPP